MLLRDRKSRFAKGFANQPVGVEIDLPVMVGMAHGSYGQYGPGQVELQNLHVGRWIRHHVRDLAHPSRNKKLLSYTKRPVGCNQSLANKFQRPGECFAFRGLPSWCGRAEPDRETQKLKYVGAELLKVAHESVDLVQLAGAEP